MYTWVGRTLTKTKYFKINNLFWDLNTFLKNNRRVFRYTERYEIIINGAQERR